MNNYDEMLKRLRAYRQGLGLKQRQICEAIGMTQEQYSYIENGFIRITDSHLRVFHSMGLDLNYLITSKKYNYAAEDFDILLNEFKEPQRNFVMKIIAELLVEKWERKDFPQDMTKNVIKRIQLLSAVLDLWNSFSMLELVRNEQGISQVEMMQKLGVGIKKYRLLEREEEFPDADILLSLYDISGYPPIMFMDIYDKRLLAVKAVWVIAKTKYRSDIAGFVKPLKDIL